MKSIGLRGGLFSFFAGISFGQGLGEFAVAVWRWLLFRVGTGSTPGFVRVILVLAAGAAWVPAAHAQAVAVAEVTGQVSDPSGAAVAGATIYLIETERGVAHAVTSDVTGRYIAPNLPVGSYRLEASASGFKSYVQLGIVLQVNDHILINVALQVGAVSESVEVNAAATMVQTSQTSVSQVVDERRMTELPLNGREATDLILISGAAAPDTVSGQDFVSSKTVNEGGAISVAGGQVNGTNYLLDGGSNIETAFNVNLPFPFPDALREFSVETSALPARNGSQPGGVVNAVTKSGSNQLHGDLFEFLRNGDVNARNYFAATHDSLKRNQFGGTVGDRIIKDKLFFFGGYQGTRNRSDPPQTIAYVPTAAAQQGDFSTLESAGCQSSGKARTINDPLTGKAFPGAQVPVSRFDPAAVKLLKYLPATTDPCGKVTYGIPSNADEDQMVGRVDWVKSDKHAVFARYFIMDYNQAAPDPTANMLVTTSTGNLERSQSITLGDTYTLSSSTVNAFHATFTRVRNDRGPNAHEINARDLGSNISVSVPNNLYVTASNAFTIGCGTCGPGVFNVNTWQFADDVDLIRGKHQLTFGVDFMRTQNNLLSGFYENAEFSFNGSASGDSMVDLMLGSLSAFNQSGPEPDTLRETMPALYVQDTFRASPRFVVNYGLRWEPFLFPVDLYHRGSVFSMANFLAGVKSQVYPNGAAGTLYYGDPGVPPGFTKNTWTNPSPRLGIVWDPQGNGKQTLRVGAAVMYDSAEVFYAEKVMDNAPFVDQIIMPASAPGGFSDPWVAGYHYPGGNPFPVPVPPPKNSVMPTNGTYVVLPPHLRPTNVAQWNVSYQRQIAGNWLATVNYLGNKSSHLWAAQALNPAVYIPGTCGSSACSTTGNTTSRQLLTLLNPTQGQYYGSLVVADDGGNADYNALLASAQHRFSHGYTMLANYTWSHCISDLDFKGEYGSPTFENPNNLSQDRSSCGFDIRHAFNLSMVAVSNLGQGWMGRILGNWQIAPLIRYNTAVPLNVLTGKDNSLTNVNLDRPNLVLPNAVYTTALGPSLQWVNPSAFAANALGTLGNLGRNAVNGPNQFSFNTALTRRFYYKERCHLEARAEAFNVLNHTSLGGPGLTLSSSTFGRIQSAGDPRILQFALKLVF